MRCHPPLPLPHPGTHPRTNTWTDPTWPFAWPVAPVCLVHDCRPELRVSQRLRRHLRCHHVQGSIGCGDQEDVVAVEAGEQRGRSSGLLGVWQYGRLPVLVFECRAKHSGDTHAAERAVCEKLSVLDVLFRLILTSNRVQADDGCGLAHVLTSFSQIKPSSLFFVELVNLFSTVRGYSHSFTHTFDQLRTPTITLIPSRPLSFFPPRTLRPTTLVSSSPNPPSPPRP